MQYTVHSPIDRHLRLREGALLEQAMPTKKSVTLDKTGMEVPARYGDVVSCRAGETLPWVMTEVS
jgi:dihydroorotase